MSDGCSHVSDDASGAAILIERIKAATQGEPVTATLSALLGCVALLAEFLEVPPALIYEEIARLRAAVASDV